MGGKISVVAASDTDEWEDSKLMRETRANTGSNHKTIQGVQTPRKRRLEIAARKEKAGQVVFHAVVETRSFQELQAPYMINLNYQNGGTDMVQDFQEYQEDTGGQVDQFGRTSSSKHAFTASRYETLKETSDHRTLGGKDEWGGGGKRRGPRRQDMFSSGSERGFSAPWTFLSKGKSGDDATGNPLSGMKLPPVPSSDPSKPRPTGILRGSGKFGLGVHKAEGVTFQSPEDPEEDQANIPRDSPGSSRDPSGLSEEIPYDAKSQRPAGLLSRTTSNSNEGHQQVSLDEDVDMPSSHLRWRRSSGSLKIMVPVEQDTVSRTRSVPFALQETNVDDATPPSLGGADKTQRKPTRVTRRNSTSSTSDTFAKKDEAYSPLNAVSAVRRDDLYVQDASENNESPSPVQRTLGKKSPKVVDQEQEAPSPSSPVTPASPTKSGSIGYDSVTGDSEGDDESISGRKKRTERKKSLGWGDNKPPPLHYKPWYRVFTWNG